jgi:hypothetical protein
MADAPSALLPNGNVLCATSPGLFSPPLHILEYNGSSFTERPTVPGSENLTSAQCNFLILPTGQIMMTTNTPDVEIYTADHSCPNSEWAPVVHCAPEKVSPGKTYKIEGIRFNGMSQGSMYGDDYQSATNYPLVRITNHKTKHVTYCRTHDHSFMGVASNKKVYTYFDVPAGIDCGNATLEVVANGIPSKPHKIKVKC